MEWRERDGVEWLEVELPGGAVAFPTRSAGSLKESHAPLATALGIDPAAVAVNRQVHGDRLVFHAGPPGAPAEADGHVLREPGSAALVFAADCLPVALAGPGGVAMLHCGRRGLAAGIVARGTEAVKATHAAIGPGIGPCCYEVGDEVLDAFAGLGEGIAEGRMLDLPEIARRLLREAGVGEIESAGLCTHCDPERFFSHRRDTGPGRQGGIAWIGEDG
jgi:YfiH family protein